jgi:hypothetical protein
MRKQLIFVALVAALLHLTQCVTGGATRLGAKQPLERKSTTMGVEVSIYVFNMTVYRKRILPADRRFLRRDEVEPLIELLRESSRILDANTELSKRLFWDKDSVKEAIGILNGTVYYSPDGGRSSNQGDRNVTHRVRRSFARGSMSSNLVRLMCVPIENDLGDEQDMTNSALVPYLYARSKWVEDVFTFARPLNGGRLELPIGESSEAFTKLEIRQFSVELDRVRRPDDQALREEYDNLRALLDFASKDPDLTLVLSVG